LYIFGGDLTSWGMGILNGHILVSGNLIRANKTVAGTGITIRNGGAGIYIDMISPVIENNIICNNTAVKYGGGAMILYNTRGGISGETKPVFINNTITNNYANYGSGICMDKSNVLLMNTIVKGNKTKDPYKEIFRLGATNLSCISSCIGDLGDMQYTNLGGNFDQNPIFKFPAHGQYELDKYSPCIGQGVKSVTIGENIYTAPDHDFAGKHRPYADVDMGALESAFAKDMDPLVAYWNFNDYTTNDVSMYENHGQLIGDTLFTVGPDSSNALRFNGTNYVYVPDDNIGTLDTDTSMTISLWIKPDSVTSQGAKFISKWYSSPQQGDWLFSLSSRDSVHHDGHTYVPWAGYVANYKEFGYCGAGPYRDSLDQNLILHEWNHIAITFDRGHLCGYYNGKKMYDSITVVEHSSLTEYNSDNIYIGRYWKNVEGYKFFGALDEIMIYDRALTPDEIKQYFDEITTIEKNPYKDIVPLSSKLYQNYPNPFNPVTTISWQLAAGSHINLSVFNILGEKVATLIDKKQPAGSYQTTWNASGFASGVYFYRLSTDNGFVHTKKLILLK
jgi:hypothetical protein